MILQLGVVVYNVDDGCAGGGLRCVFCSFEGVCWWSWCSQVTLNGLVKCVFVQSGLRVHTTNGWVFYHWKDWDCYTIHSHTRVSTACGLGFLVQLLDMKSSKMCPVFVGIGQSGAFGDGGVVWWMNVRMACLEKTLKNNTSVCLEVSMVRFWRRTPLFVIIATRFSISTLCPFCLKWNTHDAVWFWGDCLAGELHIDLVTFSEVSLPVSLLYTVYSGESHALLIPPFLTLLL